MILFSLLSWKYGWNVLEKVPTSAVQLQASSRATGLHVNVEQFVVNMQQR